MDIFQIGLLPAGILLLIIPKKIEKRFSQDPKVVWYSMPGIDLSKKENRITLIRLIGVLFLIVGVIAVAAKIT